MHDDGGEREEHVRGRSGELGDHSPAVVGGRQAPAFRRMLRDVAAGPGDVARRARRVGPAGRRGERRQGRLAPHPVARRARGSRRSAAASPGIAGKCTLAMHVVINFLLFLFAVLYCAIY